MKGFKLALIQTKGNCLQPERFAKLQERILQAAVQGAQVVVLPELVFHDYFCIEEDQRHFDLAQGLDDPALETLAALAQERSIVLVVPLFEKRAPGLYHNSALVYDADGSRAGLYRKMHIPDDPGFYEKYYFTPGDLGFQSFQTRYGRIGVLICWDQWFPEGARLTAMQGCDLMVYPTAIGYDDRETEGMTPPETKALNGKWLDAWITMQRSHAIANGVYVAAVNRVGQEGHLRFWGNSFVCDPGGQVLDRLDDSREGLLIRDINTDEVENHRRVWPFLRDRRIDAYPDLLKRFSR
ncbi:MAG: N-carbamoylputrescine amidase [Fibrobacteres bacterium]|nr:N-carbamoylputrescine amidase [Fibrobacterota bacterium]